MPVYRQSDNPKSPVGFLDGLFGNNVPSPSEPPTGTGQPSKKIAPAVLGPLITGVATLLGAGLSYANNRKYNQEQKELQREQNEYNERMLHEQNMYNSPANQMALLRQAGLNPNMAYGSVGNATSPGLESAEARTTPPPNIDLSGIGQAASMYLQYQNMEKQNELLQKEIENKEAVTGKIVKETGYMDEDKYWQYQEISERIESAKKGRDVMDATMNYLGELSAETQQKTYSLMLQNMFDEATFDDRVAIVSEQLGLTQDERKQVQELTKVYVCQQVKLNAETKGIEIDNKYKDEYNRLVNRKLTAEEKQILASVDLTKQEIKESKSREQLNNTQRKVAVFRAVVDSTCELANTAVGVVTGTGGLQLGRKNYELNRDLGWSNYQLNRERFEYQKSHPPKYKPRKK